MLSTISFFAYFLLTRKTNPNPHFLASETVKESHSPPPRRLLQCHSFKQMRGRRHETNHPSFFFFPFSFPSFKKYRRSIFRRQLCLLIRLSWNIYRFAYFFFTTKKVFHAHPFSIVEFVTEGKNKRPDYYPAVIYKHLVGFFFAISNLSTSPFLLVSSFFSFFPLYSCLRGNYFLFKNLKRTRRGTGLKYIRIPALFSFYFHAALTISACSCGHRNREGGPASALSKLLRCLSSAIS